MQYDENEIQHCVVVTNHHKVTSCLSVHFKCYIYPKLFSGFLVLDCS